jgi:hypothetical protein
LGVEYDMMALEQETIGICRPPPPPSLCHF